MINCFVPGARPVVQQQLPRGRGQTPPLPPPSDRSRKRQRTAEQTPIGSGDTPTRTPPQPSRGIIIQEPTAQIGTNVASTSRAIPEWQPTFQLDGKPLLMTTSVRVWDKSKGGRVAQSLVHGFLLPEDVHAFEDGTNESMGRRLQWHTIVVIPYFLVYH